MGVEATGYSNRAIARKLGMHRETVKKNLEAKAVLLKLKNGSLRVYNDDELSLDLLSTSN